MSLTEESLRTRLMAAWRDQAAELQGVASSVRRAFLDGNAGSFVPSPPPATDFVSFEGNPVGALRKYWRSSAGGQPLTPLADALAQVLDEVELEEGTSNLSPFTYILY